MASKKDKLIEEAQRLVVQGKLDKAIKAYEQVMELDPGSLTMRQRFAELLLRAGKTDDARAQFETIGKNLSSNGFYLKAIAIYKQIQRVAPDDLQITLILAGLNEKHGLVANALTEYRKVFDAYEKDSDMPEAVKILEKMHAVDPQNTAVGLKLAETYFQVKRTEDSYNAFSKLAALLQERGDSAAFARLDARIKQLFPEKAEFMLEVLASQVASGNAAGAINGLQAMLRTNPNEKRVWDLIVDAYKRLGQSQKVKVASQHYLKYFPDDVSPKLELIKCLSSARDIKGALDLLDVHEQSILCVPDALGGLEEIYKQLEEIDPINGRVLDGLSKVYVAAGKTREYEALAPKINSLKNISAKQEVDLSVPEDTPPAEPDFFKDEPVDDAAPIEATVEIPDDVFDMGDFVDQPIDTSLEISFIDEPFEQQQSVFAEAVSDVAPQEPTVEFEIDVDYGDFVTEAAEIAVDEAVPKEENWLDSVGEILESISTSPRGVKFDSSMDVSDAQSHYDLGMAFKEMGLYDEAINEFRQASADPERRVECIIFQGACLRDKGDVRNADKVLRALLKPEISSEDFFSAKYELALTCKVSDNIDEFARLLAEIEAANPGYRDVRSLIASIGSGKKDLDFSDDDLKGFDF